LTLYEFQTGSGERLLIDVLILPQPLETRALAAIGWEETQQKTEAERRPGKRRVIRPTSMGPMRCRDSKIKLPARISRTANVVLNIAAPCGSDLPEEHIVKRKYRFSRSFVP